MIGNHDIWMAYRIPTMRDSCFHNALENRKLGIVNPAGMIYARRDIQNTVTGVYGQKNWLPLNEIECGDPNRG